MGQARRSATRVRSTRSGRPPGTASVLLLVGLGVLGVVIAGCGADDGEPTPPPRPARPPTAATTGAAGAANKPQLAEKLHVEDRVSCPVPDKPTDPKDGACDPKAPSCPEHLYCLTLAEGSYCEPCPERDSIRHVFEERDFAVEQNRDPFLSNLWPQLAIGKSSDVIPIDPTKKCLRKDQMVATSYSYSELKLVGIVAQGTLRKVLMMGGPLGYIIKRGDCVGKEKAVVKDIGNDYVTFLVDPDPAIAGRRPPEEYSVQLNPKKLAVNEPALPIPVPRAAVPPVAPPAATPPSQAGSGAAGAPPVESPPVMPKRP